MNIRGLIQSQIVCKFIEGENVDRDEDVEGGACWSM